MNALLHAAAPVTGISAVALLNALWQDAVILATVALTLRIWPRLSAATRYAAWTIALVAAVVVPVLTTLPFSHATVSPSAPRDAVSASFAQSHRVPAAVSSRTITMYVIEQPAFARPVDQPTEVVSPKRGFERPQIAVFLPVALAVVAIWLMGVLFALGRLAIELLELERLKRDASPLPIEFRDQLVRPLGARQDREVRICVSEETEVPVAVGLFDAMVLLPRRFLTLLSPGDLEQICLHELAHLRRADDWTNLLQRVLTSLLWFSPSVYAIGRRLDLEREAACDDFVVARTGAVRTYARCLAKVAEVAAWPHRALAAPGVFVTRRGISERIERLLLAGKTIATGLAPAPAAVAIAVIAAVGFGMQTIAPTAAAPLAAASVSVRPTVATALPVPTVKPVSTVRRTRSVPTVLPIITVVQAVNPPKKHVATTTHNQTHAKHVPAVPAQLYLRGAWIEVPTNDVHIPAITIRIPAMNLTERRLYLPIAVQLQAQQEALRTLQSTQLREQLRMQQTVLRSQLLAQHAVLLEQLRGQQALLLTQSAAMRARLNAERQVQLGSLTQLQTVTLPGLRVTVAAAQANALQYQKLAQENALRFQALAQANALRLQSVNASRAFLLVSARNADTCDSACELSSVEWSGRDLHGRSYSATDFTSAKLAGVNFSNGMFTAVDFSRADLRNASFAGATLRSVNFSGALLDGANFDGATIGVCDFSGVDLSHVDLSKAHLSQLCSMSLQHH